MAPTPAASPRGRGLQVLQITTLAGPGGLAGGVWAVVRALIDAAASSTTIADVRVIAGWLGRDVTAPAGHEYVRLRRLPLSRGVRGLWSLRTPFVLKRALSGDPDVVHLHLCRDFFTMTALVILRRSPRPLVVAQCHGMLGPAGGRSTRLYDALFTRRALSRVDRFLYLTDAESSQLRALGVPEDRLAPIHNAVPEPAVRWSVAHADPVVSFVSRLHERKRPMTLLLAARELERRGVHLSYQFAGPDAGEAAGLRAAIEADGLSNVRLLGAKDPAEVDELLARSAVFVLPSVDEPYPMAVLEAAAVGTPMVVSTETGVSAVLEKEGAALVVEPDARAVADAIAAITADQRLQERLSASARDAYRRHWDLAGLARRLDEVYGSGQPRP